MVTILVAISSNILFIIVTIIVRHYSSGFYSLAHLTLIFKNLDTIIPAYR
jgi:hypothetical protein